ncbi:DUF3159 domain-containing protein [Arthrobacter monumenti]
MSKPGEENGDPQREEKSFADVAGNYAAQSGIERRDDGQIDVLKSVGGIRGLVEGILPGLVFLVLFTITRQLQTALIASLAAAAVFTVLRLIQRTTVTQAFSGLIGVGICAWVANSTGEAEDFYVVGFITNSAYIVGMLISMAVRWPIAGLLFGFIRGEGLHWRQDRSRIRVYNLATLIIIAVLALRLIVQVPLYLMGESGLVALGTTRLIMGVPLYALGLWVAWLISRPKEIVDAQERLDHHHGPGHP